MLRKKWEINEFTQLKDVVRSTLYIISTRS